MFSVLNIISESSDIFSRLSLLLRQPEPETRRTEVPGGAPFLTITAKPVKGVIPWERIRLAAGNCAGRMLLPQGLSAPNSSGIVAFSPKSLPLKLCFNTAVEILSRAGIEPSKISIGVLDKDACLFSQIEKVVMLASSITVVTDKPDLYDGAVRRFMSLYGAHLAVSQRSEALNSCRVIISPEPPSPVFFGCSAIFCPKPYGSTLPGVRIGYSPFIACVECFGVSLSEQLSALCPESIDKFLFYCALCELCHTDCLEDKCFQSICFNGSDTSFYRTCERVKQALCADISKR